MVAGQLACLSRQQAHQGNPLTHQQEPSAERVEAAFPQPVKQSTPCGECHLQPGERCDICGAKAVFTDCRSADGITVGLIDGMIATARVLVARDLTGEAAQAALADLRGDEDIKAVFAAAPQAAQAQAEPSSGSSAAAPVVAGPSDAMVEAAAKALLARRELKLEHLTDKAREHYLEDARAALSTRPELSDEAPPLKANK